MTRLKPIQVRARDSKDGTDWAYSAECWLRGEDGLFVAHVHDDIAPAAGELANRHGSGVSVYTSQTRWLASASTLQGLKSFLSSAAAAWHSGATETTRVIRFVFDARTSFWLDESGHIHGNGLHGSGKWWEPRTRGAIQLHATSTNPTYTIGLAAKVFDKIVTTRTSGSTTRYVRAEGSPGDAVTLLNSWCGVDESEWPRDLVREIPYTPDAALFLHNTLIGLCRVIQKFDSFFADTNNVLIAAKAGQPLLSAGQ